MAIPSSPPEEGERGRVAELIRRLAGMAGPDGFVPFDRFMELALYGKGVGFYAREPSPFGPEGDYYTAAHVHPLFGRALAERVRGVRRALSGVERFRVAEVGPGDGTLAASVLAALGRAPEGVAGLEYVVVERSAPLALRAMERIERAGRSVGVSVRHATSLGSDGPFDGMVLANELLDAQPARRLRWDGRAWRELGVCVAGDRLESAESVLVAPVPFPELPAPAEEGVVLEVSPPAEALMREVADHLVRGLAVFLDYGMEEPELLAAHPRGTLARVRQHQTFDDPLEDPGTSDLSVFVNFSRVRAAARRAGLKEVTYTSQSEALGRWGFAELLQEALGAAGSAEAEVRLRLQAKNLLFGFERFRVLELATPASETALATPT
jgi:SAM-dependent MidA family methyltransferase